MVGAFRLKAHIGTINKTNSTADQNQCVILGLNPHPTHTLSHLPWGVEAAHTQTGQLAHPVPLFQSLSDNSLQIGP